MEEELTDIERSWTTYEEFKREFDAISGQDWASFRDNMGDFEKFVKTWIERVRQNPEDNVCSYLHQVLALARACAHTHTLFHSCTFFFPRALFSSLVLCALSLLPVRGGTFIVSLVLLLHTGAGKVPPLFAHHALLARRQLSGERPLAQSVHDAGPHR